VGDVDMFRRSLATSGEQFFYRATKAATTALREREWSLAGKTMTPKHHPPRRIATLVVQRESGVGAIE
jgi:hypothetical protein